MHFPTGIKVIVTQKMSSVAGLQNHCLLILVLFTALEYQNN